MTRVPTPYEDDQPDGTPSMVDAFIPPSPSGSRGSYGLEERKSAGRGGMEREEEEEAEEAAEAGEGDATGEPADDAPVAGVAVVAAGADDDAPIFLYLFRFDCVSVCGSANGGGLTARPHRPNQTDQTDRQNTKEKTRRTTQQHISPHQTQTHSHRCLFHHPLHPLHPSRLIQVPSLVRLIVASGSIPPPRHSKQREDDHKSRRKND